MQKNPFTDRTDCVQSSLEWGTR